MFIKHIKFGKTISEKAAKRNNEKPLEENKFKKGYQNNSKRLLIIFRIVFLTNGKFLNCRNRYYYLFLRKPQEEAMAKERLTNNN